MRTVDQPTVQAESADTRVSRECGADLLGLRDFGRRGCERGVERCDLRRMDRELADETGAARGACAALHRLDIADLGVDGVDRRHAACRGGIERERTRQGIGHFVLARCIAVTECTEFGGEIFRTPSERCDARGQTNERTHAQYSAGGLGHHGDHPRATNLEAGLRLQGLQPMIEPM